MSLDLTLSSSEVPSSLSCIISNERWQELIALLSVQVPDGYKINIGNGTPAPADRIWPWIRLEADGKPDLIVGSQPYIYTAGYWFASHPSPVGMVTMYEGAEADIPTFNGGEAGVISTTTGAFWEKVTQMNGRIPMGPGNTPNGYVIAINANNGDDQVTLTEAMIRHHRHLIAANQTVSGQPVPTANNQLANIGGGAGQENYNLQGTGTEATTGRTSYVGGDATANEAFSILNPVRGIFFIRRTNRIYIRRNA